MAANFPVTVRVSAEDRASAPVRGIAASIRASMRSVRGNMTSASAAIRGAGDAIGSLVRTGAIAGLGAVAAATAGAAYAAKSWAEETLETGDELSTFAAKTGLSVEAIQEWRSAASRSDIEVGTFNSGVEAFSKGLGLARAGTGKLASGLKKMSPALLEQLKKTTSLEDAMNLYVSAMESVEDPSKRAALATAAFGGAGKELALLGSTGAAGVKKFRDEQRAAGVISTDGARRMGELDDQLVAVDQQYTALKQSVGAAILEGISPYLSGVGDWIAANKDLITQNVSGAVDGVASAFKSIDWDAIQTGAGRVYDAFVVVKDAVVETVNALRMLPEFGEHLGDKAFDAGKQNEIAFLEEQRGISQTDLTAAQWDLAGDLSAGDRLDALDRVREIEGRIAEQTGLIDRNRALIGGFAPVPVVGTESFGDRLARYRSENPTATERLAAMPFGLGAAAMQVGPPSPPQEITIKVESAPGTEATITKQPKAGNVKTGVRKVAR